MKALASHWSFAIIVNAILLSAGGGMVGFMTAPPIPAKLPPPPPSRRPMNCVTGIVIFQNDWDRFNAACVVVHNTIGLTFVGLVIGIVVSAAIPALVQLISLPSLLQFLRDFR